MKAERTMSHNSQRSFFFVAACLTLLSVAFSMSATAKPKKEIEQAPMSPAAPVPADYEFGSKTVLLERNRILTPGALALPCDILWERDVPVTLRDGVVMYTDILRPAEKASGVPAIVAWSPYGKSIPNSRPVAGVPASQLSGLAKFEGPEPAFWVCNGYAILNPDPRGSFRSQGDIQFWGSKDGLDGYDFIEWAARQSWSNGKVGLHGTSWLAMAQWHIAAANPPHLAAIAPWNGITDPQRDEVLWGGIPNTVFMKAVAGRLTGTGRVERPDLVIEKNPLRAPYWEDKAAPLELIKVPAYVVTDFVTDLHRMGTAEGYRRLGSKQKWFRVNSRHEWVDQYDPENQTDLLKFFDHFLKGSDNGWERTPRVRMAVIDAGGSNRENVPYSKWPLADTRYARFYLNASNNTLNLDQDRTASSVAFDALNGETTFTIKFAKATQITGYIKLKLWLELPDADDQDVHVLLRKLDGNGGVLIPSPEYVTQYFPVAPPGSQGRIRVSFRELDPIASTDYLPKYAFRRQLKVPPGTIVPVEIAILPTSILIQPGQQLQLVVSGRPFSGEASRQNPSAVASPPGAAFNTINHGATKVHTGGRYQSYLQLPLIDM